MNGETWVSLANILKRYNQGSWISLGDILGIITIDQYEYLDTSPIGVISEVNIKSGSISEIKKDGTISELNKKSGSISELNKKEGII